MDRGVRREALGLRGAGRWTGGGLTAMASSIPRGSTAVGSVRVESTPLSLALRGLRGLERPLLEPGARRLLLELAPLRALVIRIESSTASIAVYLPLPG